MNRTNTHLMRMMLALALMLVFLASCTAPPGDKPIAGADPTPADFAGSEKPEAEAQGDGKEVLVQEAAITGVQIMLMESWPLQASVQIDGELADSCSVLEPITSEREDDTYFITVMTSRPVDAECALEGRSFSESVSLGIEGLEAGTYTVDVNGMTETFTLDQDNVMQPDSEQGSGEMILGSEDQSELMRLTLERALIAEEIPDFALLEDPTHVVLSTENIDPALVPELDGITLDLLSPEEIKARADEEGDFVYLAFDHFESSAEGKATVSLSSRWAIAADSDMMYLSGGGFTIEYSKLGDDWLGEITEMWIS